MYSSNMIDVEKLIELHTLRQWIKHTNKNQSEVLMASTYSDIKVGAIATIDSSWMERSHGKERVAITKVTEEEIEYQIISTRVRHTIRREDFHVDYSHACHEWFIFPNGNLIGKLTKLKGCSHDDQG